MGEKDPELERDLRAAFAAQRPRPTFVSELRARLQPREHWSRRLLAPPTVKRWVPALAALLVVVAGGAYLAGGLHGGSSPASLSATSGVPGGARLFSPDFGPLPPLPVAVPQAAAAPAPGDIAIGLPGTPQPTLPATVPVYRFRIPTDSERSALAAALASRSGLVVAPAAAPFAEPAFAVTTGEAASSSDLGVAAVAFLAAHHLQPSYPTSVTVGSAEVVFGRVFTLGAGMSVPEVSADGVPVGLRVAIAGGQVGPVSGPFELALEQAAYPLLSPDQARARVPGAVPAGSPRLVYVAVTPAGSGIGYLEPAYFIRGPGGPGLVAAVATR